jgi:hypothetical protein
MVVSEAAMLDRRRETARSKAAFFGRSSAMGNSVEIGDVLLEPNETAAFLKVSLSWLASPTPAVPP